MKNGTIIASISIVVILIGAVAVFAYHGRNTTQNSLTSTTPEEGGAMMHDEVATSSVTHDAMMASTSTDHMMGSSSADVMVHTGDAMMAH